MLSGTYLGECSSGSATIYVSDALGQTAQQEIQFDGGLYPLIFTSSPNFVIGVIEENHQIKEIDVSSGVKGGTPWKSDGLHVKGYEFSIANAPEGIIIDRYTGIISGVPRGYKLETSVGYAVITAKDSGGVTASIEIGYQLIEEFVFKLGDETLLMPGGANGVPLGTVFNDKKRSVYDWVSGGLKYAQEPYYRFTSQGLVPNMSIDNNGNITGRAIAAKAETMVTITVEDARKETRMITLPMTAITADLGMRPGKNYSLPETAVGIAPEDYRIEIPFDDFYGGTPPYSISVENLPSGVIGEVSTSATTAKNTVVIYAKEAGAPKAPWVAHNATLVITDSSNPR